MKITLFLTTLILSLTLTSCTPAEAVVLEIEPSDTITAGVTLHDTTVPDTTIQDAPELRSEPETAEQTTAQLIETETAPSIVDTVEQELTEVSEPEPVPVPTERPSVPYSWDTVYLTFDDGPGKYTEEVLDILHEYNVTATFFVVGTQVKRYPDKLRLIAEAGHSIGAHSMTHDYRAIYASAETITADLMEWESLVQSVLGYVPQERLYRFPGGSTCSAIEKGQFPILRDAVSALGYRSFDWTFANNDKFTVSKPTEQPMIDFLKESSIASLNICGSRKIMLLHETTAETVEMLPWLIEYLQGEGFKLASLDEGSMEYVFAK